MAKERKNGHRLSDAEDTLDKCAEALKLIPVWALRRGQNWMPSEEALNLIADCKEALERYAIRHPANGGGNGNGA